MVSPMVSLLQAEWGKWDGAGVPVAHKTEIHAPFEGHFKDICAHNHFLIHFGYGIVIQGRWNPKCVDALDCFLKECFMGLLRVF